MEKENLKKALTGETGGFVTCLSSQGQDLQAPVLRMTRHLVTFEATMPQLVLRVSELLGDFKITVQNELVYSGRAVVRSLVNTGSSLVVEVDVDEGWQDAGVFKMLKNPSNLGEGFDHFVRHWGQFYKIRPELKVLIADMQVFLTDLRLWIEQVEVGVRNAPAAEREQLERDIIRKLAPQVVKTLNALFEKFELLAVDIPGDQKPAHHTYIKRQIHPLVLCSPFAYRTYRKPLGYAGDYEMVNMILRDPAEGDSMFAKLLNTWFIDQPPAEAHRNRIKYLTEKLLHETARMKGLGRHAKVFNLGCGPAREVQNFLSQQDVCNNAELTLLDFNDETIAYTTKLLNDLRTRHGRRTLIQFVKKSVIQVLKSGARASTNAGEKYDFLYCAGLFDYLPDKICKQLMNIFYDMLAPGGLLVATNVDCSNPIQQMLDYVLEWHLIYRNGAQMLTIAPDKADPDRVNVVADVTGVNIYLEVRKPAEGMTSGRGKIIFMNTSVQSSPDIREEYTRLTATTSIRNSRVALWLVAVLMPLGALMDFFVYREKFGYFLLLRFLSSVSAMTVFFLLRREKIQETERRILCAAWYIIPAFFICCMIESTEGLASTYYAGLNLVILAISSVMQATLFESITAVSIIWLMYISACVIAAFAYPQFADSIKHDPKLLGKLIANNTFFLFCTAAEVITGNYFYNRLRFREFSLRHELAENRRQLEENNQKLKELDEIKNRFFANISHELRTPLTLLLSPLETMIHRSTQQFDPATRNLMGIMHSNGMRLLKLINDLLDLVRLESGRMEVKREPVEMNAFVRNMMGAAQQMAEQKGLKLETAVQPDLGPLQVDRDKLEKTVLNLVFNALKFTPKGGTVSLRVQRQAEDLMVLVEDTGVGIAEKNLPHVFDRFWQADNSSKRKYQGVGIGLSLVKELTEIQGGSVSVKSQEGSGTTFAVRLPYIKAEGMPVSVKPEIKLPESAGMSPTPVETAPGQSDEWLSNLYRRAELFPAIGAHAGVVEPSKSSAAKNGSLPRLLVADDEPDMLRFLASQLEGHYHVIQAVDGKEAFEKATAELPHIILLDMNMPEKDGLQVCRELRAQASTAETPIIVITARADEPTKLATLSAGADDFLCKPFSTSELHVRVKNLVDSQKFKLKLAEQNQALADAINRLKETETILVQTEKMASLGRMSAGIMHEINNPLNFASTGLYTLRNKARFLSADQQDEYAEVLQEIEEGITRVKHIVTDLKSFTHPDTENIEDVEVEPLVTSALRFLSSEWKDKVAVEQKIPADLVIHGNRNKLLQVFVNVLQNSFDATRRKQFAPGEKAKVSIEGRQENDKPMIVVRDNGEGMDARTITKVFDPFFTTKDVGEGMGLGLTICYRIINEYGGRITVASEPGKFCEFKLEFPSATTVNGSARIPQKAEAQHEQHA